jgi:CubicO group peptidase (beta-lactamase class C family)
LRNITFALLVFAAARTGSAQDISARLDQYMSARAALGQFNGVALVAREGKILLHKGYGYSSLEQEVPNGPQTKFEAASITKQFVAFAIQQLRDGGKLSLNDSICRFVDSCPPAWTAVTIDHLIHHSSGIPDYEAALELGSVKYNQYMAAPNTADSIVAQAKPKPLDFAPGTKFSYSNTGYILLAKVIERVSGKTFADYMRVYVFAPLGMSATGIILADRYVLGLARGYAVSEELSLTDIVAGLPPLNGPYTPAAIADMAGAHGDGGMYTTAEDLFKWDQALYSPALSGRVAELFTPKLGYGFGWVIESRLGLVMQSHTGAVPGYLSRIERFPEVKLTEIFMTNFNNARLSRIARDLQAIVLGKPYDVPRSHRLVARDSARESSLAGSYALPDGRIVVATGGERFLEISIKDRFTAGLLPEGGDVFYAPFFEGTVKFERSSDGRGRTLTMHYDGEDRVATLVRSGSP